MTQMVTKAPGRARLKALPCLLFCLSLGSAFAQAQGSPGSQVIPSGPSMPATSPPSSLARPSKDSPIAEALLFRIRSAFSLTPSMVATLQIRGSDSGSTPAGTAFGAQKGESSAAEKSVSISWGEALVRQVPFSVPLDVKLVGKNVLALVQLVPIETGGQNINLLVQSQVWVQKPDGTLAFCTSFQSLNIAAGSRIYFYPLGVDSKNGAPIAVEIKVDRFSQK